MKPLIVYHGSCTDGFTAAWCAWRKFGDDAEYVAANYGSLPPTVDGRDVLVLDFSYPRETLLAMKASAASLRVIDHHKTAAADLEGLDFCTFDMNRSGAGLAWDELCGGERPRLVSYVEDRDLWRWALPDSREISAMLGTFTFTFERWNIIARGMDNSLTFDTYAHSGAAILRGTERYVDGLVGKGRPTLIGDHVVPCINTTYAQSELIGKMAESATFAAGWFQREDGMFVYSLRSRGDFDVSEIAKMYGGGGHKAAAGFQSETLLPAVKP